METEYWRLEARRSSKQWGPQGKLMQARSPMTLLTPQTRPSLARLSVPRIQRPCEARHGPKLKEKTHPSSQCPFLILFQGRSSSLNLWVTQAKCASFLRAGPLFSQVFTLFCSLYGAPRTKLDAPGDADLNRTVELFPPLLRRHTAISVASLTFSSPVTTSLH